VSFFCKQSLRVCSKVKIIDTESHHASWIASQNAALLGDENCIELRDRSHLCYKSIINYDLDISKILVVSPQIRYIEVFDITNPRFNEQIWPVPSDFVKSRFHCSRKGVQLSKMLVPDIKRGSHSGVNICLSWTQYDGILHGTKCLQEYVYFRESPFIFANRRFFAFCGK